ncbi:hypothetical protein [Alsobacter sp. R-9]
MTSTFRQQIAEMTQIILAEGAASSRDLAAMALIRAGFRPRMVAASLDIAMNAAREAQKPAANVIYPAWWRGVVQ